MGKADQIFDEVLAVMSGDATQAVAQQAADHLEYCTYRYNRELGVSAERLEKWGFPADGAAFERRYQNEANAYAEAKIRADKEARQTGRPEHDLDLVGRILRAGH
jgi:hypothetical protein